MAFGKTTIMKILQYLMNFNFAELIKYDFESIDIEVSAKNGRILKETLKYADLLPTDDEIMEYIKKTDIYIDDLENTWDMYKDEVPSEEKISCFDDDSMTDEEKIELWDEFDYDMVFDYVKNGDFNTVTNDILIDLKEKNKFKEIIRTIIKDEINNLYYEDYINELNYDDKYQYYYFHNTNSLGVSYNWSYSLVRKAIKNIVGIIKEYIEKLQTSNKKINFTNKEKITRMIKIIKDNIQKPVNILDMTKVYNFANEFLTSSLITNKLLEWKSTLPLYCYNRKEFAHDLDKKVYSIIQKEFEDEINIYYDYNDKTSKIKSSYGEYEIKSKDISELNSSNAIEINSIINHYFYNEDFILNINRKALEYYKKYNDIEWFMTSEKSKVEDKTKIKANTALRYIKLS